jgi:PAS domain S-box-containing protein
VVHEVESESESPAIQPASERTEHLAGLLTLSHEPMFAWRLDGPIEFWNNGAERLYGFSSDEAIGRSSRALLQTKFPTDFAELRSHLQNGRYWSGELRQVCKDGREVIVDSRMQLLGENAVLEVNRDVTEAAIFRAVFDQSGIFGGIIDLRGHLREANILSLEGCGYTREQVLHRPFWDTPWWRGSEEIKARNSFCHRAGFRKAALVAVSQ